MAKNPTTRKSENVQIARISAVQAITVALIAAIATAIPVYFAGKLKGEEKAAVNSNSLKVSPPNQSVRFITRAELSKLIEDAQNRVLATGFILDPIDPKLLADKIKENRNFEVKIVLVEPTSQIVCQRDADGVRDKTPSYEKLLSQIKRFNIYRKGLPEEKYWVKLSSHYPTMAVYIIDNDVYAHFYPYGVSGSDSPILRLDQKDKNADFFMRHFESIFRDSQSLPTEVEYKQENPCQIIKPKS
jgi:hypothetical protein